MEILIYLLKTGSLLALFFLIYEVFLKRETFFTLNRIFLISGIIMAFGLPFLNFTKTQVVEKVISTAPISEAELLSDFSFEHVPVVENETLLSNLEWSHILLLIYGMGILFFLIRFGISLFSLRKILKSSSHSFKENGFRFIEIDKEINPFTFFKTIVYNPKLYNEDELKMILHHEKTHAKQWHSLDIMLGQLLIVFQWINPIAWIYAKRMDQNLEFIADQKTTLEKIEKKSYQIRLLKSAYSGELSLPVNNFHSFTKNRIVMMNKTKSHRIKSLKALLILPLIAGFLMSFQVKTITKYQTVQQEDPQEKMISSSDLDELNKIFKDYNPDAEILFNNKKVKIKSIEPAFYKIREIGFKQDGMAFIRAENQNEDDLHFQLDDLENGTYLYVTDGSVIAIAKDDQGKSDQVVVFKPAKNKLENSVNPSVSVEPENSKKEVITDDRKGNITIIDKDGSVIFQKDLDVSNGFFIRKDGEVMDLDKKFENIRAETDSILENLWANREEINSRFNDILEEQKAAREQQLKAREEMRGKRMENRLNSDDIRNSMDSLRNDRMKMREEMRKKRSEEIMDLDDLKNGNQLEVLNESGLKYTIGKNSDGEVIALLFEIDKNTTDAQFEIIIQKFRESDIDFQIQKIKRNKAGEITDLKMTLNNRKGANSQISQQGSDGIKAYKLGMNPEGKIFMISKN